MRIIAGELKGRRIEAPKWDGLRPTSDKLRETLFNVLAPRIAGARLLDAYAGTGAVGIEALSRGAAHVTFVEKDPRAVRLIEANLERCGVEDRYAIIRAGLADTVKRLGAERFDIIFLDPPYGADTLVDAVALAGSVAAADTVIVIEHASKHEAPAASGAVARVRVVRSGDSALSFYRRVETA